jgi:hypothetical protein
MALHIASITGGIRYGFDSSLLMGADSRAVIATKLLKRTTVRAQYLDIPSKTETGHRVHVVEGIAGHGPSSLHLHLLEAVLPRNDIRGGTILAVVEEDDHPIGVHGLAGEKLKVLELGEDDILGVRLGLGLELLDLILRLPDLLEMLLDGLHVPLQVGEIRLLVERSALKTERVDDVVDLDFRVLEGLLGLLGGRVGTGVNLNGALGDHGAVGLVDDAIDLLEVVRVRDDLVIGDNVLVNNHLEDWFVEFGEIGRVKIVWTRRAAREGGLSRGKKLSGGKEIEEGYSVGGAAFSGDGEILDQLCAHLAPARMLRRTDQNKNLPQSGGASPHIA